MSSSLLPAPRPWRATLALSDPPRAAPRESERRGRGASAVPSRRFRAPRPSPARRAARRSGRSRSPRLRAARARSRPRASRSDAARPPRARARRARRRNGRAARRCPRARRGPGRPNRSPSGRSGPPDARRGQDVEAGVLARDPVRVRRSLAAAPRLDPGVLEQGVAVLDRLLVGAEELDLPLREAWRNREPCRVLDPRRSLTGRATAAPARCDERPTPPAARSRSPSSRSRENGSRSAVACTSTRRPAPVMTTFMSVSARESSA